MLAKRSIFTIRRQLSGLLHRSSSSNNDKILRSPFADLEMEQSNVAAFTFKDVKHWKDETAICCSTTGEVLKYGELQREITKLAFAFSGHGIERGDRVALLLPNSPLYPKVCLALNYLGATAALVNPASTAFEVQILLKLAKVIAVVIQDNITKVLNDVKGITAFVNGPSSSKFISLDSIMNESQAENWEPHQFDFKKSLSIIPFSSGTTGPPKGVSLTHFNITSSVQAASDTRSCSLHRTNLDKPDYQDTFLSILPFYHIFGILHNLLLPLHMGVKLVSMHKFDWHLFLAALLEHRPSCLNLVPPLVMRMAQDPAVTKDHLASVRTTASGAAPLSPEVVSAFLKKGPPNMIMREGYAMTECPTMTRVDKGCEPVKGSVGKLTFNLRAKFLDLDTGEPVGPGQVGEIYVKGPQVMPGYYGDPSASSGALNESGWLKTGDIGQYDTDGNIFLVDRRKDLIKYKGQQVSPTELENVILSMAKVKDVCVVGVNGGKGEGEVPKAFVVSHENETLTEKEVEAFVAERLSDFKRLRGGVMFVNSLPKSPTGKVLRRELREKKTVL